MFQHVGRVATPKLASRNCFRFWQATTILYDWSSNISAVLSKNMKGGLSQSCFFKLKVTILDVCGVKNGFMTN